MKDGRRPMQPLEDLTNGSDRVRIETALDSVYIMGEVC